MNISMNSFAMPSMSATQGRSAPPPPPPPNESSGQTEETKSNESFVSSFDTDNSGGLSATEVAESHLSNVISEDNWSDVDTDGDGSLTVSELDAHRESMGPGPMGEGQGGPGRPGGGGMGGGPTFSQADSLSLFEGLVSDTSDTTGSGMATNYAEELYTAMQSLLTGLED